MFWSLDLDDCKQLCSGDSGCYLLKSIYKALNGF